MEAVNRLRDRDQIVTSLLPVLLALMLIMGLVLVTVQAMAWHGAPGQSIGAPQTGQGDSLEPARLTISVGPHIDPCGCAGNEPPPIPRPPRAA